MKFKWQLFILILLSWAIGIITRDIKWLPLLIIGVLLFIAFKILPNEKFVKEIYEEWRKTKNEK